MLTANEHLISSRTFLTPALSTDLPDHRGIWVGTGGTLDVVDMGGSAHTIAGIQSGTLLPIRVRQITGGTASGLLLFL